MTVVDQDAEKLGRLWRRGTERLNKNLLVIAKDQKRYHVLPPEKAACKLPIAIKSPKQVSLGSVDSSLR